LIKKLTILTLLFSISFGASLDKMIGQMLLVGVGGSKVKDKWVKVLKKDIQNGRVGGVIIFKNNIDGKKELKRLTSYLNPKDVKIKPFIAIDEEGGEVQRLFKKHKSAFFVADKLSLNEAYQEYTSLANELKEYGFNLDFAPVVDLNTNPKSPAIGAKNRSYSAYEEIVIAYSNEFIRALEEKNIISVIKHFPGHGSALRDTHKGFVDITNSWDYKELKPYYYFIKYKKVDAVMVGHLTLKQFDQEYPATLSKNIVEGILREKLGFNGVVFSDDMQMGAIKKSYGLKEAVIKAINAGVDVLVFSSYFTDKSSVVNEVTKIIKNAVKTGDIKKERLKKSYDRIVKLKERL